MFRRLSREIEHAVKQAADERNSRDQKWMGTYWLVAAMAAARKANVSRTMRAAVGKESSRIDMP